MLKLIVQAAELCCTRANSAAPNNGGGYPFGANACIHQQMFVSLEWIINACCRQKQQLVTVLYSIPRRMHDGMCSLRTPCPMRIHACLSSTCIMLCCQDSSFHLGTCSDAQQSGIAILT